MPKLPSDSSYEKRYHEEHDPRYLIIQHNHLVQDTRFTMPLEDQKVLASLIRSIKPHQKSLDTTFSARKYMHMLGLRNDGTEFDHVVDALYNIMNDNFFIKNKDGSLDSWIWFAHIHVVPNKSRKDGIFKVQFNSRLRKYLFSENLKYRTIFRFDEIMFMQSKYSPRLYEILRSNKSRQKHSSVGLIYSINELHYNLGLYHAYRNGNAKKDKYGHVKFKYPRFSNFNEKIIKRSIKEINTFTDNNVKFTPVKKGRKVVAYKVVMKKKTPKQLHARDTLNFRLSHHMSKKQYRDWYDKIRYGTDKNGKPIHPLKGQFHVMDQKLPPFKEVNLGGGRIEFWDPYSHKLRWVKQDEYFKLRNAYQTQQRILNKIKKR